MPCSRYSRGVIPPEDIRIKDMYVIQFKPDEDGFLSPFVVSDEKDMSIYGTLSDWSLNALINAGIDPSSFSSPTVAQTRLSADAVLSSSLNSVE